MSGTEIREARLKLQRDLFKLIVLFEKGWDVHVASISLEKTYQVGSKSPFTTAVEVRVEI